MRPIRPAGLWRSPAGHGAGSGSEAASRPAAPAARVDKAPAAATAQAAPVTRLYLRARMAAAFALIMGVLLYTHLSIEAMREEVRSKTRISEALTAAQTGLYAVELGLHDLVAAGDVWRAEESRASIRNGREQLLAATARITHERESGALHPDTEAVLANPMLRPLENIALMIRLAEPLLHREGPRGAGAKRHSTLAIDVSRVTQPALLEMRTQEYAALIAATDRLATDSVFLSALCLAALGFSAAFIFLPLERRVMQSQEVILRKTEAAEAASRSKSQFLATMSHEIRTPMNGVLGMAELMGGTRLDEKQHKMLEIIRSCGQTLVALLDDILDLSRLEANAARFERRPFDIRVVVDECTNLFAPLAGSKGVHLDHTVAADVAATHIGDETRLRQIINNLVSNAVKFTESGSVRVRVGVAGTEGDRQTLTIDVQDSGIGIPKEAQARIFDVFEQADTSTTRRFGGTGLGLTIVKRLAEGMDGDVRLTSTPGVGSTFTATVRLGVDAAAQGGVEPAPTQGAESPADLFGLGGFRRRVLVVDDDGVDAHAACAVLRGLGCDVRLVRGAAATIAAAEAFGPELVLVSASSAASLDIARHFRSMPPARRPHVRGLVGAGGGDARETSALLDGLIEAPITLEVARAAFGALPAQDAAARRGVTS